MTDDQPDERDEPRAPPKPLKKRKKKPRQPLTAEGVERPRFLLGFPRDPELERLISAFEAGDYLTVRRDAPTLREQAPNAKVQRAAQELLRRIEPDPLMKYLLLASVLLLGFLALHSYFGHGR